MEKPIKTARRDIPSILREAQRLIVDAASASGEKAVEMRQRAHELMHEASEKAAELRASSKEAIQSADEAIKENPYKAILVAGTVGLLLGLVISKK